MKLQSKFSRDRLAFALILVLLTANLAYAAGQAQWPDTTTPRAVQIKQDGYKSYATRTSDGNFIIAIENSGIEVQKLDSNGNKLWNGGSPKLIEATGFYLRDIVSDGAGGAFIVYNKDDAERNAYVKRIAGDGTVTWTASDFDADPLLDELWMRLLHDGNNGVFVIWSSGSPYLSLKITHLNSLGGVDGNWNLGAEGAYRPVALPQPAGTNVGYRYPRLVLSDAGSVIVVFYRNPTPDDLFIVKYANDGSNAWGGSGYLTINDANPVTYFQAEPDGNNGVFIGYQSCSASDCYNKISIINSNGTFNPIGDSSGGSTFKEALRTDRLLYYIKSASDSSGNLYLAWNERIVALGKYVIYVQKFNNSGVAQWPAGGVLVSQNADDVDDWLNSNEFSNIPHEIVADGSGGAIVGMIRTGGLYEQAIIGQKINSDGSLDWGDTGHPASDDPYLDYDGTMDVVGDGAGGAFFNFLQWDSVTTLQFIVAQYLKTATPSGPCEGLGEGQVCGSMTLECPTVARNFVDLPDDFQLGSLGQRNIRSSNDTSYVPENSSAYFNQTDPGQFTDGTDSVSISSNTPFSCGAPANAVNLTIEATPFENLSAQPLITYGADGVEDSPAFSNDDYAAMFSVITSGATSCSGACVLASGSVEVNGEEKNGESNYFANAGPNDSTKNTMGFDANALLLDTDGGTNTVTLYSASNGFSGTVAIPGLDFSLILPANLANGGTYSSQVTYTLF